MAPTASRKSLPARTKARESSDGEAGVRARSPDNETSYIATAKNLVAESKKRKEAKRKAIEDEHKKRMKDLQAKVQTLFDERKSKVTKMQRAQWERLNELNKKRHTLEAAILRRMSEIELLTTNTAMELNEILTGRLGDIESLRSPIPSAQKSKSRN